MRLPGKAPAKTSHQARRDLGEAEVVVVGAAEHEVAVRALHDAFAAA
jgi:hypothetical protein